MKSYKPNSKIVEILGELKPIWAVFKLQGTKISTSFFAYTHFHIRVPFLRHQIVISNWLCEIDKLFIS